jgi:phenylpyruvate tautomerase PptA (4-oxalocrotonate tautomerase family)
MHSVVLLISLVIFLSILVRSQSFSFLPGERFRTKPRKMSVETRHPFCDLPGDPSLILTTNVDLGSKRLDILKAISKAMAEHTGKPEEYIAVSINDKADVIFAGNIIHLGRRETTDY